MKRKKSIPSDHLPPDLKAAKTLRVDEALALAMTLHRAGGLEDAETLYTRVLAAAPDYADALHFMGVLQNQRGRTEQALNFIQRSIAINSTVPDWHNNLGNVLLESGQLDAAADAYAEAVRLGPERPDIQNNLGVLRREQRRPAEAEAAYLHAIALDPRYVDARVNLASMMSSLGRHEEALRYFFEAVVLSPKHAKARKLLGMAHYQLGDLDAAAKVYREWLEEEPDNPEARHHMAACTGTAVPGRAADAYVESVFDSFANSFDAKLAMLDYRAPALIAEKVASLFPSANKDLIVLDAGCGTGLCGPLLAPYAKRLEGIDISAGMLAKAEPRQVYNLLSKAELTAFIAAAPEGSYDLIVSADTLCYFGELEAVSAASYLALRPGGRLIFTVEALDAPGEERFHLHPHGRYSHRDSYVRHALVEAGLEVASLDSVVLRNENATPVQGWLAVARRHTDAT